MRRDCVTSKEPQAVQPDLLLHFNNNFDDAVSGRARVRTPSASFADGKFGKCYDVGGLGSNFLQFDMRDKLIGTQDFTVDTWLYCKSYSTNYSFRWIWTIYFKAPGGQARSGVFNIRVRTNVHIQYSYCVGTAWQDTDTGVTLPIDSWHHLCVARNNGILTIYLDGINIHSVPFIHSLMDNGQYYLDIGNCYGNPAGNQRAFNGMIDEFRLVVGTAAWTSNFTPPTEEYLIFQQR